MRISSVLNNFSYAISHNSANTSFRLVEDDLYLDLLDTIVNTPFIFNPIQAYYYVSLTDKSQYYLKICDSELLMQFKIFLLTGHAFYNQFSGKWHILRYTSVSKLNIWLYIKRSSCLRFHQKINFWIVLCSSSPVLIWCVSIFRTRLVTLKPILKDNTDNLPFIERNEALKRPISPHLSIYKIQMTSVLSITHRVTGVAAGVYLFAFSTCMLIIL